MPRWERLYDETLDKYGGRYEPCQWEDEDANGDFLGRHCTAAHGGTCTAGVTTGSSSERPSDGAGEGASFDIIPHP